MKPFYLVISLLAAFPGQGLSLTPCPYHSVIEEMLKERNPANPRPLPGHKMLRNTGRSTNGRVICGYARKIGRNETDSVLRNDFVCNDDITGGCQQRGPDIAVALNGNIIITWYEFRDGDADVWFQRFDSAGNPVGSNQRVNTDPTLGWQGDPAGAIGIDGRFIFSWEDRREIGNSDVYAQRFDETGARLGDNFRVSDSTASGDQSISSVHIGPDGSALIVWDDRRYGLTGDIFGQFLNPDGSARGENFRVNDDAIGWANQYEPDVSGDDSGRYVVVWMDGRGNNPSDWNIFLQRFRSDGTRIGNNNRVTSDDSIQWSPRVGTGPTGEFVVCWDDRRRGQWDVYAQIYNRQAEPVGENFRVNADLGNAQQLLGDVAVNRFGEFIVVWADNREGNDDIYAQRFNLQGSRLGPEFKVNDDSNGAAQNAPTVAASPDGGYWISWADARSKDYDIYCQRIARDGTRIGTNFRVNDDFASAHQRVSTIGRELGGSLCIAWEDERNANCEIYGTILDASGNQNGSNIRINDDPIGTGSHYYPSAAGGNGKFLVAWVDSRQGWDIYAQFLNRQGEPVGGNFLVNTSSVSAHQWYPYCAMDSANRAVITWMDNRTEEFQIYARLYDENGNPVGTEFPLADTTAEGYYGSVAMNSSGYWVAAWMDRRDGDINIYCQLFRPDGAPIRRNIRVNTDTGGSYQGYPACAIDDNRNIVIAWEDTRNGSYDVYLQWLDSVGNRCGDNERVNDDPGNERDSYSPTCAFDNAGRLVVMFNDEREVSGNPQIYCQRFNPDRTRISNNQKINEPNLFPKNTHWTVGQSVAVSEQVIAFTWTDNRRHQGWDIYAKLTDWNLIGHTELSDRGLDPVYGIRTTILRRDNTVAVRGKANTTVCLYDAAGRRVYAGQIKTNIGVVRISHLGPGIYFLTCRGPSHISTNKLLIL